MSVVQPKSAPVTHAVSNIYLSQAMDRLPQILSTIDREPFSKTYGSFDRTYWCWKFTDFSASRFQEGLYTLSYFYRHQSPLCQNPHVLEWIKSGFKWWQKLQHRNGAFDEAYPFEMSYAATAFTCFYLGEAYDLVKSHLPQDTIDTFRRAGEWFKYNDEKHGVLTNHLAAGAAALMHIARITGDDSYKNRAQFFINRILDKQSSEGWYEEYGGADIGYQTHGMFYFARIWQMTGDAHLLSSLERASDFIEKTINPDGTIGGEYASRNTEFYYPAAFEMLSTKIPSAARIAQRMRDHIADGTPVGIPSMDGWNLYPVLNNYLFASLCTLQDNAPPAPAPEQTTAFKDAGIIIHRSKKYQVTMGISKGGVIKAWGLSPAKIAFADCGYWMRLENGTIVSSQSFLRAPAFKQDGGTFSFECEFTEVNQKILNPITFMGFRGFSVVTGQIPALAYWLKNLLVKTLVKRRKSAPFKLQRTVTFTEDGFDIRDTITPSSFTKITEFCRGGRFATIHMGSSRYFQWNELSLSDTAPSFDKEADTLAKGLPVTLEQSFKA